jgi:hypothetical protein
VPVLARQVSEVQGGFWIGFASHKSFINALTYGFTLMPEYDILHWYSVVLLLALGSAFIMIRRGLAEGQQRKWVKYALLLYFVPQVVLFIISLPPLQSFFHERYTIVTLPFFIAALAYGAVHSWKNYPKARYFVAVLFIAISSVGVFRASSWGTSTNWGSREYFAGKSFFEFTESKKKDGDVYLASSLWTYFDTRYYQEIECNHRVLLYETNTPPYKYGNASLIYDRTENHVRSAQDARLSNKRVWIFDEQKPKFAVPSSWVQLEKKEQGYGSVTLYQTPALN